MKIRYFADTDTVYLELNNKAIVETRELNENTLIDVDADGNLVAITLEHALELANIDELTFQQVLLQQPEKIAR